MNKNKRIWLALVFLLIFGQVSSGYCKGSITLLKVAQTEIGHGEISGNNRGQYVRQYLNGRENLPWCAGFVSYCLRKSGISVEYTLRAKDFLALGKRISRNAIKPGDIVVFTRKGGGHTGIVEQVFKDRFISIEGNVGDYPAKVKRISHKLNKKSIVGFVRMIK
jgi:uncharacterized protein (TIGR02594 family)